MRKYFRYKVKWGKIDKNKYIARAQLYSTTVQWRHRNFRVTLWFEVRFGFLEARRWAHCFMLWDFGFLICKPGMISLRVVGGSNEKKKKYVKSLTQCFTFNKCYSVFLYVKNHKAHYLKNFKPGEEARLSVASPCACSHWLIQVLIQCWQQTGARDKHWAKWKLVFMELKFLWRDRDNT